MNRQLEAEMAAAGPMSGSATASVEGRFPGLPAAVLHKIRFLGPLTIAEIATFCAVSRRDVEAAVEELRLSGEPIVAGNDGLHLTENPDELETYVQARRRRIASIYLGNRSLRRTARRMREVEDERIGLTLWAS